MVKLNNDQLKDTNDTLSMSDKLVEEYERCERQFYNILDYQVYKENKNLPLFEEMLIKDIPVNVKRYLTKNNVLAYEFDGSEYITRASVKQKRDQTLEHSKAIHLSGMNNRNSMINIKESANKLKLSNTDLYEEDKEESKGDLCSSNASLLKSRNFTTERGNSSDDSQALFHSSKRRLSFSKVLEERYLANAPVDDEHLKNRIHTLVRTGQIFDESKEYLFHLLSTETEQGN